MGRPSKYPRELRERAVRMVAELRPDYPSEYAAMTATAQMLGIGSPETIRTWIRRNQVDTGQRPGVTTEAAEEIKRLKRENAELRRANEILKAASGFLRGRARPATEAIVAFISDHKDRRDGGLRWGVESICAVLTQHGCKVAPSTYYDARGRGSSSRKLLDERWKPIILQTWIDHRKVLGARKLWLRLRRDGHDIARCTVERLMRELGIAGVVRGKRKRPVDTDLRETRPADLVDRHFARFRTNQLWVADFTYVWTWSGWVYVAFVFDAHSRRILGWRAATSMTTPLVLDCLDMALWTRRREGVAGFGGLTHHTDTGSVYTSIAFTDRLVDEGIDASVGSVGDAYDNSLAESQIGLYKSELIHHEGPWRDVDQVEAATASWVLWFNTERTHGSIDDLTPLEVEQLDYARIEPVERAG
ncbi:IS3 family transposase [Microbacterium sp. C7(2022)]|uniref:IS3 family transposase n=1 Tax=Microbacterium sp. C7(2022) TaxID=2992759 RepID=UPI00237B0477|nr:IS3 family transposase [Microbacterium sp. C7(2022)]MDE0547610.1 IS3 family transposase [Microbacterium sp. C7(2022)]